jgi:hypothetical protein
MVYGPFHSRRCKDDIAAALLDDFDDERSLRSSNSPVTGPSDQTERRDPDCDTPSFLSNEDPDTTPLTGPAADDE